MKLFPDFRTSRDLPKPNHDHDHDHDHDHETPTHYSLLGTWHWLTLEAWHEECGYAVVCEYLEDEYAWRFGADGVLRSRSYTDLPFEAHYRYDHGGSGYERSGTSEAYEMQETFERPDQNAIITSTWAARMRRNMVNG